MGPFVAGILIPLGVCAMIFGIAYIVITSRNRERMALIERGADPKLFEAGKKAGSTGIMKLGLFLLGIGLGIFIANVIVSTGVMNEEAAYPSMIFIFGGLALIVSYLWQLKQEKLDESKQ
jgi:hypothetical protein